MPNRILRDSIRSSPTLDKLSAEAERLFYRLLTAADDFGRFQADPRILLAECFPLKVGLWKPKQVERWRTELVRAGAVALYAVNGRVYGHFQAWPRHNRIRAKDSKHPAPDDSTCEHVPTDDSTCEQMTVYPNPNPNPDAYANTQEEGRRTEVRPAPAGRRLPDGWEPSELERDYAKGLGLDADAVAVDFTDYWHAVTGQKATKRDWTATWQRWCRKDAEEGRHKLRYTQQDEAEIERERLDERQRKREAERPPPEFDRDKVREGLKKLRGAL